MLRYFDIYDNNSCMFSVFYHRTCAAMIFHTIAVLRIKNDAFCCHLVVDAGRDS